MTHRSLEGQKTFQSSKEVSMRQSSTSRLKTRCAVAAIIWAFGLRQKPTSKLRQTKSQNFTKRCRLNFATASTKRTSKILIRSSRYLRCAFQPLRNSIVLESTRSTRSKESSWLFANLRALRPHQSNSRRKELILEPNRATTRIQWQSRSVLVPRNSLQRSLNRDSHIIKRLRSCSTLEQRFSTKQS